MEIIVVEEEIVEVKIGDLLGNSPDKAAIIENKRGIFDKADRERSNEVKEKIAIDAIEMGVKKAAELHGVPFGQVSDYANAEDIKDPDTKTRILDKRHSIGDLATTKLMETLNLFDPNGIEKQKDIIAACAQLASVVDKVSNVGKNNGNQVVVNFYPPKQKSIEDYSVIEVGS